MGRIRRSVFDILKALCKALHKAFYGKQKIMQSDQHKSPYIHIKQALLCIITLHKYYGVVLVRVILPELKVVI